MTTLKTLLDEAGGLPNAEAVWAEHVAPGHPHLELCNYFAGELDTEIYILDTSTGEDYSASWDIDDDDLVITPRVDEEDFDNTDAYNAAVESGALFLPVIDQILSTEIDAEEN